MSDTKKKSETKPAPRQKISPAKEKPEITVEAEDSSSQTEAQGVSAPGVVFLSLLTTLAVLSAAFAFRSDILPYLHRFLEIPASAPVVVDATPLPGFVPIPTLSDSPALNDLEPQLAELRAQQTALETEIIALRQQQEKQATVMVTPAPVETKIIAAPDNSAELAEALNKIAVLEGQLGTLQQRTLQLAKQVNEASVPVDVRGLVAFQTLQSQALAGQPFRDALQRVVAMLDDSSKIESTLSKLEQIAQTGRPSLLQLQQDFATATSRFMQQADPDEDETFLGKVKQNMNSLVRIRRTDGNGDAHEAIIAAAEKALMQGNVKQSYAEILKLPNDMNQPYAQWLQQARQYYELPERLQELQLELTNSLEAGR